MLEEGGDGVDDVAGKTEKMLESAMMDWWEGEQSRSRGDHRRDCGRGALVSPVRREWRAKLAIASASSQTSERSDRMLRRGMDEELS